jgi:very-short-patch-repair endonuclease
LTRRGEREESNRREEGADGGFEMRWRARGVTWGVLRSLAREMRSEPTPAEGVWWQRLRRDRLGARFRRQMVIGRYIVDFFCAPARLVLEVDGDVHEGRRDLDEQRDRALQSLGLRVLRFTNDEVLADAERVVARILAALSESPASTQFPFPPPRQRGGGPGGRSFG